MMPATWECRTCGHNNPNRAVICRGEDCPAAAAARRTNASIASNVSWARTPDRSERTAGARAGSPTSYEYWLTKVTAEGVVREADRPAAAASAHRAYMQQLSKKAAAARSKNARTRRPQRAA